MTILYRVSFWCDKHILELGRNDGYTQCESLIPAFALCKGWYATKLPTLKCLILCKFNLNF